MDSTDANNLETCQAVMVALGTRRFVIFRRGEPTGLRPTTAAPQRVRDLTPGDEVIYKGRRYVVRSVQSYE
jgi:hypothetical protein